VPWYVQRPGTVSSGRGVSPAKTRVCPRKNSTWYPLASGTGAHAKRLSTGLALARSAGFGFVCRVGFFAGGTVGPDGARPISDVAEAGFSPTWTRTSSSSRVSIDIAATPMSARDDARGPGGTTRSPEIRPADSTRPDRARLPRPYAASATTSGKERRAVSLSCGSTRTSSGLTTSRSTRAGGTRARAPMPASSAVRRCRFTARVRASRGCEATISCKLVGPADARLSVWSVRGSLLLRRFRRPLALVSAFTMTSCRSK